MEARFVDLNNLSWKRRPFALSNARWKKGMGYRFFFPECNHALESHTCQLLLFFLPYFQDYGFFLLPWQRDETTSPLYILENQFKKVSRESQTAKGKDCHVPFFCPHFYHAFRLLLSIYNVRVSVFTFLEEGPRILFSWSVIGVCFARETWFFIYSWFLIGHSADNSHLKKRKTKWRKLMKR